MSSVCASCDHYFEVPSVFIIVTVASNVTIIPPPKVMGGYVFAGVSRFVYRYTGIYDCEQPSGAIQENILINFCYQMCYRVHCSAPSVI